MSPQTTKTEDDDEDWIDDWGGGEDGFYDEDEIDDGIDDDEGPSSCPFEDVVRGTYREWVEGFEDGADDPDQAVADRIFVDTLHELFNGVSRLDTRGRIEKLIDLLYRRFEIDVELGRYSRP